MIQIHYEAIYRHILTQRIFRRDEKESGVRNQTNCLMGEMKRKSLNKNISILIHYANVRRAKILNYSSTPTANAMNRITFISLLIIFIIKKKFFFCYLFCIHIPCAVSRMLNAKKTNYMGYFQFNKYISSTYSTLSFWVWSVVYGGGSCYTYGKNLKSNWMPS